MKTAFRIFRYLFYRIYIWDAKYSGDRGISAWKALLGVSFLSLFVLFGAFSLVAAIVDPSLGKNLPKSIPGMMIPGMLWIGIHYFLLVNGGRLGRIEREFGDESREQRKRGTKVFAILVVLSLVIPYIALLVSGSIARALHP